MTTSGKPSLRTLVVAVTIGSFSLAALMGVAVLLGAGDFGETEFRILLTTLILGCSSLVVLCYAATDGTPYRLVGAAGAVADLVASVIALGLTWGAWDVMGNDSFLKAFGVATVAALTLAQVCLLLGLSGRRPKVMPLLWVTVALAAVLGVTVSAMILGLDGGEGTARFVGVVAILDLLGTVVTIALAAFGAPASSLTVTIPPGLASLLRGRADATGRPVRDLVDEALARYVGVHHD